MSEGGIDAGEAGGGEPPRRLMRAAVRTEPQAVVRSTLPEGRRMCPHGVQRRQAEAKPVAGTAGQGERGAGRDEHGAKRWREENAAVVSTTPSNAGSAVAVGQGSSGT